MKNDLRPLRHIHIFNSQEANLLSHNTFLTLPKLRDEKGEERKRATILEEMTQTNCNVKQQQLYMRGFNFSICTRRTKILSSSIMTSSLFGISCRFYSCLLFICYWFFENRYPSVLVPTYHLLFPFILYSSCIVVFIDNSRTRNDEYANLVRYVSQQRRRTRFPT